VLPRGRGTTPTLRWAGLPCSDLRKTAADAREGRLPALSGVWHHDQGLPGGPASGTGPPRQTLPAVTRVRSTATPCR